MKSNTQTKLSSIIEANQNLQDNMKVRNLNQEDHILTAENPVTTNRISHCSRKTKEKTNIKRDQIKLGEHILHGRVRVKLQEKATLVMKKKRSTFSYGLPKEEKECKSL